MNGRLTLRSVFALAAIVGMGITPAAAQERPWYFGVDVGIARAGGLSQTASGIRTPTRCDPWLYAGTGFQAPSDAGCLPEEGRWWWSSLTPGTGLTAGVRVGRALDRFRVEAEVLDRRHGGDRRFVTAGGQDLANPGADSQWNPLVPPSAGIADFRATQAFLNAYWDFPNASRVTPFAGVGVGWAWTAFNFDSRWIRKTVAQGYLDIRYGTDWPEAAKRAAAGTISLLDKTITGRQFGWQVPVGVDYAVTDRVSLAGTVRWAQFADLQEEVTFVVTRSHEPVQADGSTSYARLLEFQGLGYWAATVGLRYRF